MFKIIARLLPLLLLGQILSGGAAAQQNNQPPSLNLGDAVVTGFSGTVAPDPSARLPRDKTAIDLTFIDPDGPSARIIDLSRPGFVWDGRLFNAPKRFNVLARDVGQVFGVALDDALQPNIYLAATSAFGLNLVARGRNGLPERRKKGGPGVGWMKGQFGFDLQGGPGAIYKIDGRTGVPTLFANVTLDGVPNPGPALGNLAYDAKHKQLFVSDLYTGMIHRYDLDGRELERYDHGVTGLAAAGLAPVPFDPRNRPNIGNAGFDSENPNSWGFAPAPRRVWGLAVHQGRLYYSVMSGPQIWSIGIARDGGFAGDPRWELDVPAQAGPLPISDIAFSNKGAMILAQRALIAASYDYSAFTRPGEPKVFRVWLKGPNDPPSPGRWKPELEEYAVGFAGNYRNTNGGVALGYGYDQTGTLGRGACEYSLWTTGQKLRDNPGLKSQLDPGGPLVVNGLAGVPASPVRGFNEPPWVSYAVDYDDAFADPQATGHMGGVRIYSQPCAAVADYGGPGNAVNAPYTFVGDGGCVGPNCGGAIPVNLAVEKTAGKVSYDEKTGTWTIEFKIDVSNPGNPFAPGNSISISDPVPPGMTFVSATGTNWTCSPALPLSSGNLNCGYNFGSGQLNTGTHLNQLIITATTTKPGVYENCANVGIAGGSGFRDSKRSDNRSCAKVDVEYPPNDVSVEKISPGEPCAVESACTFTIKVTNNSPWPFNGPISVGDNSSIPMNIASTDLPCTPPPTAIPFTCPAMVSLPAGPSSQTFTITGVIPSGSIPLTSVEGKNCATLNQAAPIPGFPSTIVVPPGPDCKPYVACGFACHMTQSQIDEIKIEKSANSPTCSPGGQCSYTFTISNLSTTNATSTFPIAFIDSMPPGATTFVPPPTPAPWTCLPLSGSPDNIKCLYPPSSIPPGGQLTVVVTFQISPNYSESTLKNCSEFFVGQTSVAALRRRGQNAMDAKTMQAYLKSRNITALPASSDPTLGDNGKSCTTVTMVKNGAPGIVSKVCPPGTTLRGNECVPPPPPACLPPMVPGAIPGQCACPDGTTLKGKECVKVEICPPPMIPGAIRGQCICPRGMLLRDGKCVTPIECRRPLIPNAAGTECVCRDGYVKRGRTCVERLVCHDPARLNRRGTACICPNGMTLRGNRCVERGPRVTPEDIIRNIPGVFGPGHESPRGGSGGGDKGGSRGDGKAGVR